MKSEIMNKLLELSKRGVGGEKENAKKLLEKLMKKNGMTYEDLETLEVKTRYIKYKNNLEMKLACQILYMMDPTISIYNAYRPNGYKDNSKMRIDVTDSVFIEFEYTFSILKKDLEKELDLFYKAFVVKNHLYPAVTPQQDEEKEDKITWEEAMKMQAYASAIDKSQIRKALGGEK